MAHVILFEHANFHGVHKHVFTAESNLNADDDNWMNDKTSSIVVIEGNWEFFIDWNFSGKTGRTLGPGIYPWVSAPGVEMENDAISSLRPI